MKYHLDAISSTLNAIGGSLACEGIRGTPGFAEEIKTVEKKLRQLYSDEFPKDPFLFAAALAINAMALGIAAAEHRQRRVEERSEKLTRWPVN